MRHLRAFHLLIAAWMLSLSACSVHRNPTAATQPTTQPSLAISAGPYLQAPADTSMTIMWMTNHRCVSRVEYAENSSDQWKTAFTAHDGLIDANATLHKVRLSILKPGTTYRYRAISRQIVEQQAYRVTYGSEIKSPQYTFTTLDAGKEKFSFVVLNDRHEKLPALRTALSSIKRDGLDLVFYNGDMVNYCQSEAQIMRSVVKPSELFAATLPFIYVRGNHDTRGPAARGLMRYFPTKSGRCYYSFDHGGVHFVILDTGEDKRDDSNEYFGLVDFAPYLAQETEWLKQEVRSPAFREARFRVVIMHIPPIVDHDPKFIRGKWLLENWVPLLENAKVDLMLCGHEHMYMEMTPQPPARSFPIIANNTNTVVRVDVSPEQLDLMVYQDDGSFYSKPGAVVRQ